MIPRMSTSPASSLADPAAPPPVNPRLALLNPYPFERLRALTQGIVPNPD